MISDLLRRNWYWILGVLVSFLLFIISPILFIIVLSIVLLTYFLIHRRRGSGNKGVTESRVRVVRSYGVMNTSDVKVSRVCLGVGIGDSVVRIGDNWVSALAVSALDQSLMRDAVGLGAVIIDGNNNYLVIYGNDINEVSVRLNTAVELLRSRNIPFRQLSPSEVINEVVLRWMS